MWAKVECPVKIERCKEEEEEEKMSRINERRDSSRLVRGGICWRVFPNKVEVDQRGSALAVGWAACS